MKDVQIFEADELTDSDITSVYYSNDENYISIHLEADKAIYIYLSGKELDQLTERVQLARMEYLLKGNNNE